jgi:transposase InsO family protein
MYPQIQFCTVRSDGLSRDGRRKPSAAAHILAEGPEGYGLLILWHGRRQILCLGVTAHPAAEWMARQLTEAFGWERTPQYIVRDRDCVYGGIFTRRLRAMGIRDQPIAPRSPWQNGHAERLIGSLPRALTMSSSTASGTCANFFLLIWRITILREPTYL